MAKPDDENGEPDPEGPADPDTQKEYIEKETPSIEHLAGLSDEELHHMLGHKKVLEEARAGLAEAQKLTGKARDHAEKRIEEMFTPHIYGGEFKYLAEDARRAVKDKSKEAALNDTSPSSVL
jgi:hypothetical protein